MTRSSFCKVYSFGEGAYELPMPKNDVVLGWVARQVAVVWGMILIGVGKVERLHLRS
jgi:hypothetical protein